MYVPFANLSLFIFSLLVLWSYKTFLTCTLRLTSWFFGTHYGVRTTVSKCPWCFQYGHGKKILLLSPMLKPRKKKDSYWRKVSFLIILFSRYLALHIYLNVCGITPPDGTTKYKGLNIGKEFLQTRGERTNVYLYDLKSPEIFDRKLTEHSRKNCTTFRWDALCV